MRGYTPLIVLAGQLLAAALPAPASGAVPAVQSLRAASSVTVDGKAADWPAAGRISDPKSVAEFAFQNDGRSLYILITVRRPAAQESLESTGLTVLGGPAPVRKPSRGVLFLTRPVPADGYIRWHESQGLLLTEAEKSEIRGGGPRDLTLAFAVGPRGSTYGPLRRQRDAHPPGAGVARDEGASTYELEIPLASPDIVPGAVDGRPGETIRVAFEWGGAAKKILGTKATRETPPSEKGELSGSGGTWGQEFLYTFDSLSRPAFVTKRFAFTVDVRLADAR